MHSGLTWTTSTNMTFTLTLTLSIGMAAVEDGGVVFQITNHSVGTQGSLDPSSNLHWGELV